LEVEEKVLFQIARGQKRIAERNVKEKWHLVPHSPVP